MTFTACNKNAVPANVYLLAGKTLQLIELPDMTSDSIKTARKVELNLLTDTKEAGSTGCNLVNNCSPYSA